MSDNNADHLAQLILHGPRAQKCRVCNCTDVEPCFDPATGSACYWVEVDLCSTCRDDLYLFMQTPKAS